MPKKPTIIELNRRRIANAYLDFCQRHFGGKWADVVISATKVVRVEISQQSIETVMKEFIETMICTEFGTADSQKQIARSYSVMLSKDRSHLSVIGKAAMAETMQEAVAFKLNNPDSDLLQVVP